ncbi:MAG: endonuclease MutS2 [Tissierellia bacterium]|nr:endonuclease MutS2 [Tissierellia bacterium]
MNERSIRVLEYEKIIKMLANSAQSEIGRKKCMNLKPINTVLEVERLQEQTEEGQRLIIRSGSPPLYGLYDLVEELGFAVKGGVLHPQALLRIADSLRGVRALKKYLDLKEEDESFGNISSMISGLYMNQGIEDRIGRAIVSEEEIADDASPELRTIRISLRRKNDDIKTKLNGIINSKSAQTVLQEPIITIRGGRYVVPVRSEYRSRFAGVVHDQSGSGATVFIEPMSVVQLNNEIRVLESREQEEITRILRELTGYVAEHHDALVANQEILSELDFIFARGRLALEMQGTRPILNEEGRIHLKKAKHPLLNVAVKVPIDIRLGEEFTTLVITGPNTGGKTVTLKTVGLLTLMALSGLHIPAETGSQIAIFDDIYSDIGDEQSIEQSLSTFSSHMTNIVSILELMQPNSLVLLDELGAGTDPTEGAALAMAILEKLRRWRIRTIATTHYSQLKLYALSTEGVQNASVEFDVDTLSPTYRLLIGVPGKSNAFEISRRLGLEESLIGEAKELLSRENIEFEDVLTSIERDRRVIEEKSAQIRLLEDELAKRKEKLDREIEKNRNLRSDAIEESKRSAQKILEEARAYAQDIIKEVNRAKTGRDNVDNRELHRLSDSLREKLKDYETQDPFSKGVKTKTSVEDLKLGDEVELVALGQRGQVVELPDAKGNLILQIGILKVNSNVNQIRLVESQVKEKSKGSIKNIYKEKSKQQIEREIDLRGQNIEEAIRELDKFIDDASLMGLEELRIIHGKGTGVLREGVRKYLKKHRQIGKMRFGEFSEGGDGVTVATLK